jgi:hypothetical protein
MITETYKGRKLRVKKGREWGTVDATVNGEYAPTASCGSDQAKGVQQLRDMIDWIDEKPVDGSRWGAEWYAPGTYTLCESGHPVALDGQCQHPFCIKQREEG